MWPAQVFGSVDEMAISIFDFFGGAYFCSGDLSCSQRERMLTYSDHTGQGEESVLFLGRNRVLFLQ